MSKISKMIKKFRLEKGLNQEDLASMLGKSKSVISNWERGDNSPDLEMVERMCEIFEVTPNEMYEWESRPLTIAAHADHDLSEEEQEKVREYIKFLEAQRKK